MDRLSALELWQVVKYVFTPAVICLGVLIGMIVVERAMHRLKRK